MLGGTGLKIFRQQQVETHFSLFYLSWIKKNDDYLETNSLFWVESKTNFANSPLAMQPSTSPHAFLRALLTRTALCKIRYAAERWGEAENIHPQVKVPSVSRICLLDHTTHSKLFNYIKLILIRYVSSFSNATVMLS